MAELRRSPAVHDSQCDSGEGLRTFWMQYAGMLAGQAGRRIRQAVSTVAYSL